VFVDSFFAKASRLLMGRSTIQGMLIKSLSNVIPAEIYEATTPWAVYIKKMDFSAHNNPSPARGGR
jgi:hypothetical protein